MYNTLLPMSNADQISANMNEYVLVSLVFWALFKKFH